MPAALKLTITKAGRAALVNAERNGTAPMKVSHAGLTATAFVQSDDLTAIPAELKRVSTISGGATAADTIHVTIRDDSADTYSLRGLGLYFSDGTLFACYSQATVIGEKSAQASFLLASDTKFADINAASLTFGDTNFQLNKATSAALGIVRLALVADAVAGYDDELAVTPAALKGALDDRLGKDAPTGFVKGLLSAINAAAFRAALAIKGAASYDMGHGNGLNADLLDGRHGSEYAAVAHTHTQGDISGLANTLDAKAPLASPVLTGAPTAPTAPASTNTAQLATTAFVQQAVANLINGAPGSLDTLRELADAMGDDPNFAATMTNAIAGKAPVSHAHTIAQVAGLGDALDAKASLVYPTFQTGVTTFAGDPGTTALMTIFGYKNKVQRWAQAISPSAELVFSSYDANNNYLGERLRIGQTGPMTVSGPITSTTMSVKGAAGAVVGSFTGLQSQGPANFYQGFSDGVTRWGIGLGSGVEWALYTYNAAGAYTGNPLLLTQSGNMTISGSMLARGGFDTSDIRLKYQVQNAEPRPLHRSIRLHTWRWKSDAASGIGGIAQQVMEVAPEYVNTEGEYFGIDKAGLAFEQALWAGAEIDRLHAKIQKLIARLDAQGANYA